MHTGLLGTGCAYCFGRNNQGVWFQYLVIPQVCSCRFISATCGQHIYFVHHTGDHHTGTCRTLEYIRLSGEE